MSGRWQVTGGLGGIGDSVDRGQLYQGHHQPLQQPQLQQTQGQLPLLFQFQSQVLLLQQLQIQVAQHQQLQCQTKVLLLQLQGEGLLPQKKMDGETDGKKFGKIMTLVN